MSPCLRCRAVFGALLALSVIAASPTSERSEPSLREVFKGRFDIGFGTGLVDAARSALVAHHASAVTCENYLKPRHLRPAEHAWRWEEADRFVEWVESTGARPVGHTLVWCYMMPRWVEEKLRSGSWDKAAAIRWQGDHIRTVLSRYGGRIPTWDVVNEALSDAPVSGDGRPDPLLRADPWSDLCGVDYIIEAFRAARAAAPDATLIYNDYNLEKPEKRARLLRLLDILDKAGCKPDAVGIQAHCNFDFPLPMQMDAAIREIAGAGCRVHITELDVSVYAWTGGANLQAGAGAGDGQPVYETLPPALQERLARRYRELFKVFLHHSDKIDRVSFWNIDDGLTWLNNWPVKGRPNHPLLFDRELRPKAAFYAVVGLLTEPGEGTPGFRE